MFAIPGIIALVALIYIRPQEFVPSLQALPLLYLFLGLALFGLVIDIRLRRSRAAPAPQSLAVALFFAWCLGGLALRDPSSLVNATIAVGVSITLWLIIAHGVQTFRALSVISAALLCVVLFVSWVAVDQGGSELGCHVLDESAGDPTGVYDGRPCITARDCYRGDPEPGAEYNCELVGRFGTSSVGGRVRYRGQLNDPNELSLAAGIALPLAFAFYERKRSLATLLLVAGSLTVIALCAIYSQSRGGQLVFLTVIGAYFVKRYGWKGLLIGAVVALPILLFGGRSGEEAESSSLERLGCWYEGMSMVKTYPLLGVGQGQFVEHHTQTAHNSFILAPAELGLPGMFLWSVIVYLSLKIPIQALRDFGPERGAGPAPARTWAMALLASWLGLLIGIFFLSFCYHPVLWIWIGLSGALWSAIRTHEPEWKVEFRWADAIRVMLIDAALIVILFVYTRIKGAP